MTSNRVQVPWFICWDTMEIWVEDRRTGAPDDGRIIMIHLNDLGLLHVSSDYCYYYDFLFYFLVEWRINWGLCYTLLKLQEWVASKEGLTVSGPVDPHGDGPPSQLLHTSLALTTFCCVIPADVTTQTWMRMGVDDSSRKDRKHRVALHWPLHTIFRMILLM